MEQMPMRVDAEARIRHHLQQALSALEAAMPEERQELDRPPRTPDRGQDESSSQNAMFCKEGEFWTIRYSAKPFRLKDSLGLAYIARLLAMPSREVHALDLAAMVGRDRGRGGPGLAFAGDAGEVLDPQAKAAYRRRLAELREDLDEATTWGDYERAARAQKEIDAIADQLASAVGLGGRDRRMAAPAERARVSTTKAIRNAIQRMGRYDGGLHEHLSISIRTGTFLAYVPDPVIRVNWRVVT